MARQLSTAQPLRALGMLSRVYSVEVLRSMLLARTSRLYSAMQQLLARKTLFGACSARMQTSRPWVRKARLLFIMQPVLVFSMLSKYWCQEVLIWKPQT